MCHEAGRYASEESSAWCAAAAASRWGRESAWRRQRRRTGVATGMFATLDAWGSWAQRKEGEEVARRRRSAYGAAEAWLVGRVDGTCMAVGALGEAGGGARRREREDVPGGARGGRTGAAPVEEHFRFGGAADAADSRRSSCARGGGMGGRSSIRGVDGREERRGGSAPDGRRSGGEARRPRAPARPSPSTRW